MSLSTQLFRVMCAALVCSSPVMTALGDDTAQKPAVPTVTPCEVSVNNTTVKANFVVAQNTVYVNASAVLNALNQSGLNTSVYPREWDISTPYTLQYEPKNPGFGDLTIKVNGLVLGSVNTLSLQTQPGRAPEAYVPVWYLSRLLSAADLSCQWNGKYWQIRNANPVLVRKMPYPYSAMLAMSSDADHETLRKFNLVHEFLNTAGPTPLGQGLGLDISDSFFMYNGSDLVQPTDVNNLPLSEQFTYFQGLSSTIYGGKIMDTYIHDGWLDSIHTFGDFSMMNESNTLFTRDLAAQAISQLDKQGDLISVWIDHGNKSNVDNFGAYGLNSFFNYQQGALPQSIYYHTDLTVPYGIKYVWPDLSSDQFGMNSMLFPIALQDGRLVWGFWRYCADGYTSEGSPLWNWGVDDLPDQLAEKNLASLEHSYQFSIVANHLSSANRDMPFTDADVTALQNLAREDQQGKVLVARTSRLLNYNVVQKYVHYETYRVNGTTVINMTDIEDPVLGQHKPSLDELRGLTFYVSNPANTQLAVNGQLLESSDVERHASDGFMQSIGVKWFSPDVVNHAQADPSVY